MGQAPPARVNCLEAAEGDSHIIVRGISIINIHVLLIHAVHLANGIFKEDKFPNRIIICTITLTKEFIYPLYFSLPSLPAEFSEGDGLLVIALRRGGTTGERNWPVVGEGDSPRRGPIFPC